jgi:hypothetical protein
MGYATRLKLNRFEGADHPIVKVIFTAVTTGLCGSITSFSGWQLQCNKSFFLQWDFSWGNAIGSYNGGRFMEWMVCMWGGIVLPLSALHFGFYVCSCLHPPMIVPKNTPPEPKKSTALLDLGVLLVFCLVVLVVILIPIFVFPNWLYLTYAAGNELS